MSNRSDYRICRAAYGTKEYEGVRDLWHKIFGDPPDYIDAFFENFGGEISAYAFCDASGNVCSALTRYLCGSLGGVPVYVSYAVCTDPSHRGLGLAGALTEAARADAEAEGALSIVSPAGESLEAFYEEHGYEPYFYADERTSVSPAFDEEEFDDFDEFDLDLGEEKDADSCGGPFKPGFRLERIGLDSYNKYREAFLCDRPHIELSSGMLRLIETESMDGCGLFSVNKGDAVCVISGSDAGSVRIAELLVNPLLLAFSSDIESEIAGVIAEQFGSFEAVYRAPGRMRCQSMLAGSVSRGCRDEDESGFDEEDRGDIYIKEAYFGFPVD